MMDYIFEDELDYELYLQELDMEQEMIEYYEYLREENDKYYVVDYKQLPLGETL